MLNLFVLRVAGQADHLHAVEERRRNVERIRGCDEHDVGEIVFHLDVVIHERVVLLRVQHLE